MNSSDNYENSAYISKFIVKFWKTINNDQNLWRFWIVTESDITNPDKFTKRAVCVLFSELVSNYWWFKLFCAEITDLTLSTDSSSRATRKWCWQVPLKCCLVSTWSKRREWLNWVACLHSRASTTVSTPVEARLDGIFFWMTRKRWPVLVDAFFFEEKSLAITVTSFFVRQQNVCVVDTFYRTTKLPDRKRI